MLDSDEFVVPNRNGSLLHHDRALFAENYRMELLKPFPRRHYMWCFGHIFRKSVNIIRDTTSCAVGNVLSCMSQQNKLIILAIRYLLVLVLATIPGQIDYPCKLKKEIVLSFIISHYGSLSHEAFLIKAWLCSA